MRESWTPTFVARQRVCTCLWKLMRCSACPLGALASLPNLLSCILSPISLRNSLTLFWGGSAWWDSPYHTQKWPKLRGVCVCISVPVSGGSLPANHAGLLGCREASRRIQPTTAERAREKVLLLGHSPCQVTEKARSPYLAVMQ